MHCIARRKDDDDDDDDDAGDDKPVRPTWAVGGALFRGVRRIHIYHVFFHIPPVVEESQHILM